jgi:hypothetical protein
MGARVFKTRWFAKAARKARISDLDLCKAIEEVRRGLSDDLGGGVFKKRLDENRRRSIILAKIGSFWIYEYLFAKKDQANIDEDDLNAFRKLAKVYASATAAQWHDLEANGHLVEICHA